MLTYRGCALSFALALVLLAVACTSITTPSVPTGVPSVTPSPPLQPTRLLALLSGQLALVDGCFRVDTGHASVLIGWTPVFNVRLEKDSIEVVDTLTGQREVWHVGDPINVGGASPDQLDAEFRHGQPADCQGPYFVMHTF